MVLGIGLSFSWRPVVFVLRLDHNSQQFYYYLTSGSWHIFPSSYSFIFYGNGLLGEASIRCMHTTVTDTNGV